MPKKPKAALDLMTVTVQHLINPPVIASVAAPAASGK